MLLKLLCHYNVMQHNVGELNGQLTYRIAVTVSIPLTVFVKWIQNWQYHS